MGTSWSLPLRLDSTWSTVWDANAAGPTASIALTILGGPIVTLSQYTGPTGTTVTVTGSGFNLADTFVTIKTVGAPPGPALFSPATVNCGASGGNIASGCAFTVSSIAPGLGPPGYTLEIKGSTGDPFTANFLLTTTFFVNPNNGGMNTQNVQISGTGYFAGAPTPCIGSWYEAPVPLKAAGGTCNIDTNGVLLGTIAIINAGAALGAHTVGINDGTMVVQTLVTTTFTVTQPTLTLTPNTGTGGDTIQFTGTGFSSGNTAFTLSDGATNIIDTSSYSISGGTVSGSFKVKIAGDPAQAGTLTLQGNLQDLASAGFTVVPQISHTLTPGGSAANPARVGSTVTVTGSNWAAADLGPGGVTLSGAGPPPAVSKICSGTL